MSFWQWSRTSATNASADPTINMAEGMPPAQVNDGVRALMAAAAKWRDDISGTITTGGTANAYTVASNSAFDTSAHMNGAMIAFIPHITNGAIVTLNVDGIGNKPLRSAPGVELGAGVMVQGTPYVVTYVDGDGAFYLQGFTGNPFNIPIGGMLPYFGASAPNANFILPFGQLLSRTTYATFFGQVGTTFGVGDGVTTFGAPDLRGRGVFGLDNMGGSAANRITVAGGNFDGTVLGQTGGGQNQTLTSAQLPVTAITPTLNFGSNGFIGTSVQSFNNGGAGATTFVTGNGNTVGANLSVNTINFGSGNFHPIVPPAMMLPYILRII